MATPNSSFPRPILIPLLSGEMHALQVPVIIKGMKRIDTSMFDREATLKCNRGSLAVALALAPT
jgi:hypothetical protein